MNLSSLRWAALLVGILSAAADEPVLSLAPVTVHGESSDAPWSSNRPYSGPAPASLRDGSEILRYLPGASRVGNGPLTGILQVRGLTGEQVGVRVDGATLTPACPNHMDPPLHYARISDATLVQYFPGVVPVSEGAETLGGLVSVSRANPVFAEDGSDLLTEGTLYVGWHGDYDSFSTDLDFSIADKRVRFDYEGSFAEGDDLHFPGGRVRGTGFETQSHDVTFSLATKNGFISLTGGVARTREAGTPALPMDMIKDDSWSLGIHQQENFDWGTYENRVFAHGIDHLMDNSTLRPVTGMSMQSPASSNDYGWRSDVTLDRENTTWKWGLDLHRSELDADQVITAGPMTGWSRDTFNDSVRQRAGVYGEWEHNWSPRWTSSLGLRADYVAADSETVQAGFGGPMVAADAAAFNAADRALEDLLIDAVGTVTFRPTDAQRIEFGIARKNRAPSVVERYIWSPFSASSGRADGRSYLGNLNLDPETCYEAAVTWAVTEDTWNIGITPFYRYVDNYIQGEPTGRLDANGRSVLQFQNLDHAQLYGAEAELGWQISDQFDLLTSTSYTRGTGNGDDLYRLAPWNGSVTLGYSLERTRIALVCDWAADQNRVSEVQGESTSSGYALLAIRFTHRFNQNLSVEAGIENLLDESYSDHLAGVNRVAGSDVAVGDRLPGAGRSLYVGVTLSF